MSVLIELTQTQLDSIAAQQAGSIPPVSTTVVTYEHGAQQPVQVDVNGRIWVADLTFNGKRFETNGLMGQPMFYFRFVIPSDINSIGWQGKVAQIGYSEDASHGGQQFTKTCSFEKNGGAMVDNIRYGSSGNYLISFGFDYPNAIRVEAGEVWYLCVEYKMQNGTPSAKPTDDGDMQVTPGAPGVV